MNNKIKKYILILILTLGIVCCILTVAIEMTKFLHQREDVNRKEIGIITIAIGRYNVFWKNFYTSCEKYFLPQYHKHYFLFTDTQKIVYHNKKNVHIIEQKKLGWPYDSMMRYDFILSQKENLEKFDYLFFFNINALFTNPVGEEVIPNQNHDDLVIITFNKLININPNEFAYERNKHSTAYIPYGKGKYYAQGGFNGGTSKAFLELSETCSKNINTDLKNKIIAKYHDESHLNKYILNKNPLVLDQKYLWPEEYHPTKDTKIILRDKDLYGGKNFLRMF